MKIRLRRFILAGLAFFPNAIKVLIYRFVFGAKIGKGVRFGFGAIVLFEKMEIGSNSRIGRFAFVDVKSLVTLNDFNVHARAKISVHCLRAASRTTIGERTQIMGSRESALSSIELGMYTWIFQDCYINVARPLKLSHNVGVGGGSYIFTHGYWLSELDGFPVKYGEVTIERDVWLPWSCFIMPGVTIGERTIVGARSVVNRDIPKGVVAAGSPAVVVREKSHKDNSMETKVQMMTEWVRHFLNSKNISYQEEKTVSTIRFSFGKDDGVFVHLQENYKLEKSVLNIVCKSTKSDEFNHYRIFSLEGSFSSAEKRLSALDLSFFRYCRSSGLRHYPKDEWQKSEQFLKEENSINIKEKHFGE